MNKSNLQLLDEITVSWPLSASSVPVGAVVLLENKKAAQGPPLLNRDADQNS
ncbi:hypothetical protein [Pseudomonas mosselii]|uniref:hypothetical protein n=1 Tax=Pseudomonas mosselii TaxID=78327 RepID=UPI00198AE52D|nr:hypothetical protein [Pseudomonas mosselii]MBC7209584.1 hypothetical protein [Pseudomonas sp.]MBS9762301.1 hypothetical protein [Pseudomonas mosselii]